MKISGILSPDAGDGSYSNKTPSVNYRLRIRQQPVAARSYGFGEKDKRAINPPPIIQFTIESLNHARERINKQLHEKHYVMSYSIYSKRSRDATFISKEWRQERQLLGTLVSTSFIGKDEYGEEG